mmetsp:Transcript_63457/g.138196  ORF Transcript_63457/g.138196 Transcript_63457/m.138196 type:complete len:301 (+) Transcript_63457:27-929(+)
MEKQVSDLVSPCASQRPPPELSPEVIVRWAVQSLYVDEALPRGPLLQWLLQLLVGVKLTHKQLRGFIEAASGVSTDPPSSKKLNFRAVLEEPPAGFKGFVSEEEASSETLGEEVWEEARLYMTQGGWPKADDASHKYYVVASWLQDSSAKLRSESFGRVLSIVRYGAQAAGLLGHRNGLLVPYAQSEECERRVNACTGQPTHVAPNEVYVKTWDELRGGLRRLLMEQPGSSVEVSKVKALFRSHLGVELSETVFGHQCLSKLLGDEHVKEEFVLESFQGNRYLLRMLTAEELSARASGAA